MGGRNWVKFFTIYPVILGFLIWFYRPSAPLEQKVEITTIDVLAAKNFGYSDNRRYLDVRTEEEFREGHVDIENILNIPHMFNTPEGRVKNPKFLEQVLAVFNKDDHLVVGCQLGIRSVNATIDLLKAEFKHVYNMGGGYAVWVKNNLPVKKPTV